MTRPAPRCNRQSVKPPVEVPTSRQIFPTTSICQCLRACSSLRPPRLTYLRSSPRRRMSAEPSTPAPAFSIFCPFTSTLPARISAWARSRDFATPRSSNNLSSRTFKLDPRKWTPEPTASLHLKPGSTRAGARCRKYLAPNKLSAYFPDFPQNFAQPLLKSTESMVGAVRCSGRAALRRRRRPPVLSKPLAGDFLQQLLVDIEIGVEFCTSSCSSSASISRIIWLAAGPSSLM